MKAFKYLTLLFALLFTNAGFSNTIYLEYDETCMDRYAYQYTNSANGFKHIVYHVRLNDQQKVIFEVGIENRVNQRARPSDVKTCKDLEMNERFVRKVNKGDIQLYLVKRVGNEYNVSPVGLASYAQITPSLIGYSSIDHVFAYNFREAANGKNIATKDSEAKVYYNGTVSHSCPKKYQFTKIRNRAGKNYSEMILIPEVGVIEEKTGFNQTDAENNKMELLSINNIPLNQYIQGFCQGKELNYKPQGVFYSTRGSSTNSGTSITDLEGVKPPTTTNPTTTTGTSTSPTTTTTTGVPQTKCNVYKDIDRNLYIDWSTGQPANTSCGGNTFRNGFMVSANTVVSTPPTTTYTPSPPTTTAPPTTRPTYPSPAPNISGCTEVSSPGFHVVQRNETLYGIARLYGVSHQELIRLNRIQNPNRINPCTRLKIREAAPVVVIPQDPEDWKGNPGSHIVNRGETIYQLAKKYGYSVSRFRSMNDLSPADPIYVGQVLKTNDCNCPSPDMATARFSSSPSPADIPVPADYGAVGQRLDTRGNDTTPVKRKVHIVKENETVYTIAKSYGISVSRLRTLNKLEENEIIYPFQRLYIN